jgi:eukaryotic-like serine/threonine-protein kinase
MALSLFAAFGLTKKHGTPICGGRYRVIEQVGEGGMGKVYRGETRGAQVVAVKEVLQKSLVPQDVAEAEAARRHEAHILSILRHPCIPRFVDAFQYGGRSYLVMEYVEGKTLSQCNNVTLRMPLDEVLDIGRQLCGILGYLHSLTPSVLFLDLKPSNIMRTPAGEVYLVDFGIARQVGITYDLFQKAVPCTPKFASPEQRKGIYETTTRSDVYGLGATLFDLTRGFGPPSLMALLARMRDPEPHLRPSLEEVSEALSADFSSLPLAISATSLLHADEPTVIPTLRIKG